MIVEALVLGRNNKINIKNREKYTGKKINRRGEEAGGSRQKSNFNEQADKIKSTEYF